MTSTAGLILKLLIVVIGTICTSMQAGGTSTRVSFQPKEKVNIANCGFTQQLLWYRCLPNLRKKVIMDSSADSRISLWTRFKFNDTHQMFGIKKTHNQWFFMQRVGNKLRLIEGDYPNNVLPSNDRVFIVKPEAASRDWKIRHGNTYLTYHNRKGIQFVENPDLAMPICISKTNSVQQKYIDH